MSKERFKLTPAVYLVLRQDNEVLLLRRANTGYQDGKYGLVSGHLEGNESATEGMAREAREEAGIELDPRDLELVHVAHRLGRDRDNDERIDLFFQTSQWEGEITNAEPEKCDDLSWFALDQLPENMVPLIKRVIEATKNGVRLSEYTEEPK